MSKVTTLYAIIETDGEGNEKFFTGLLRAGHYNRNYKLSVYKYKKSAENRLRDIIKDYENTNSYYSKDYREVGDFKHKGIYSK